MATRATRARRAPASKPKRTLILLFLIIAALFGGIAATTVWAKPAGQWTPKLGLDLEGGRQVVLEPVLGRGQQVSSGQVNQAVNIIRQRVDGTGVAEAEVSTLGDRSIVVAIPGNPSKEILDSLAQSSKLTIRPVIATTPPVADAAATAKPSTSSAPSTPSGSPSTAPAKPSTSAPAKPSTSAPAASTSANAPFPEAYAKAAPSTPAPSTPATSKPATSKPATTSKTAATTPAAPADPVPAQPTLPGAEDAGIPATPSDPQWGAKPVADIWVTNGLAKKGTTYQQLMSQFSCRNTDPKKGPTAAKFREISAQAPEDEPSVACAKDGNEVLLMGPVEVDGSTITDASFGQRTNQQGIATGEVAVNLEFNEEGKKAFGDMTRRLSSLQQDQNRSAINVDGVVISAPGTNGPIVDGRAEISGGFTSDSAKTLADQLKFGALPFSFKELTSDQISPQLGTDQLQKGLIAGAIGLLLVVLYSLFQYRALGLVTVASLIVAGLLTYGAVTFLGYANNFRLTMAGITGLIVAIGITADSFIVYFERVRDEVRSGRPLRAAVETGWARARRTILISDAMNFIAAAVLYVLSESSVKAFAFTLGVTTLIDLLVVVMFTHPVLSLLARTKFFGDGHKWSGFDPERLGAKGATYAGRGRVTIADRKAAAAEGGML
ncbi:protein translocase subunit SecD [Yimella sp. RIT 621]|uniref:protein translocase subunit SecD n=1 Tax=unclassified Yimella TaxID=2649892 RepID=UPI00101CEC6E|nr:protein translocase subunit SecD [Yimella sp. RIT 621]MCG8655453.1 protein translocase subunit SecD [Yimella sp. NH-Cas1]RYG78841.1 protein translocase subunit SecD [Yimella sp. RIT 621]